MRSIVYAFQDLSMKHSLRSHEAFAVQTRSIELKFNMKQSVPLIKHAPKARFIGQSPTSFFMCDARFISKKKSTSEEVLFFLSFVSEKELGENRGFSRFIYHFNSSKNISIITTPQTKVIIIETINIKYLIHFCSTFLI